MGGGVGMSPWCIVLVCSWLRLLADRHSPPFPWTLSFCRRRCPSASHRPVPFLFFLGLSFPLYLPFLSLGRLCRRSPRNFPVSLRRVGSTRRRATSRAVGQGRPSGHPKPAVWDPIPNGGFWALGCPLAGSIPRRGHRWAGGWKGPAPGTGGVWGRTGCGYAGPKPQGHDRMQTHAAVRAPTDRATGGGRTTECQRVSPSSGGGAAVLPIPDLCTNQRRGSVRYSGQRLPKSTSVAQGGRGGGGGWHKASVSDCLPLAAPTGLSPPLILTLCGPERGGPNRHPDRLPNRPPNRPRNRSPNRPPNGPPDRPPNGGGWGGVRRPPTPPPQELLIHSAKVCPWAWHREHFWAQIAGVLAQSVMIGLCEENSQKDGDVLEKMAPSHSASLGKVQQPGLLSQ